MQAYLYLLFSASELQSLHSLQIYQTIIMWQKFYFDMMCSKEDNDHFANQKNNMAVLFKNTDRTEFNEDN